MSSAGQRADVRGGDRVLVGGRPAVVMACGRRQDKSARRGGRRYQVRFEGTGETAWVSRASVETRG